MQNAEETAFNDRAGSKGADGGGEKQGERRCSAALTSRKRGSAAAGSQGTMPALARVQIPFLGARSQESAGSFGGIN